MEGTRSQRSAGDVRRSWALTVGVVAALASAGCSTPSVEEAADTSGLPIPGGAAVRRLPPVGEDARADRLVVSQATVYRSGPGWPDEGPNTLHVEVLGDHLLVLSGVHGRIDQFTLSGDPVAVWDGRAEGQLTGAIGMAVRDERVVVVDISANRISRWRSNGDFIDEVSSDEISRINLVLGATERGLVVSKVLFTQDDEQQSVSTVTETGEEVERYTILPIDRNLGEQTIWPRPRAIVSPNGKVYASTADRYRVHAFRPDGTLEYVLDVDWPRAPVSESARRTVERTRRAGRALGANVRDRDAVAEIPEQLPALENLEVDGRGRLYVFPLVEGAIDRYPVDVYSPDGDLLAATWLPFQDWEAQSDDDVYRIEADPDTGETIVVRYRIELNLP